MIPPAEGRALRLLARQMGIQTRYRDMNGRPKEASQEALVGVLQAMGSPIARPAEAKGALEDARRGLWEALCEPVVVAWEGRLERLAVRVPSSGGPRRLLLTLHLEEGGERSAAAFVDELPLLRVADGAGSGPVERAFSWPGRLPLGVHRLVLELGGRQGEATVLSAPRKADGPGRGWGIFSPTYAVRSADSGLGDFGDLRALAAQAVRWGARYTGTLPLLPLAGTEADASPYAPASRLFWNELFVDLGRIPEVGAVDEASALLQSPGFEAELGRLRQAPTISYAALGDLKRRALAPLATYFYAHRGERFESGAAFEAPESVWDYARFRARREGPAGPEEERQRVHLHVYLQWLAERQLAGIAGEGGGLYLDFPIGVHNDGYDPHRHRELFAPGASVGAPPDAVFPGGQNWGFAPLLPRQMRLEGYAYLRRALSHHMRPAGLLRIDHAAFLHRLLWIPKGLEADQGVYVRYPTEELAAVVTLASHRHGAAVVGEDLGLVPQAVRRDMARHGLRRMHVVPLELGPERIAPPKEALACLGTHDMAPFAAWCEEDPKATAQLAALLGAPDEPAALLEAALSFLAASRAEIVLVSLQDLYLGKERHNIPGTPPQGNWRQRMPVDLESLADRKPVKTLVATVDRLRKEP